jgi:selenocysteine-specific elongation factor
VEVDELQRGAVLADAAFAPRTAIGVRVRIVADARAKLRKRTPVRVTLGASETIGTLVMSVLPSRDEALAATLVLRAPMVTYPEQPFVLRTMSPAVLLGGGSVTAAGAPGDAAAGPNADARDPNGGARDADEIAFARALSAAGERAATAVQLAADANLRVDRVEELAAAAVARGEARAIAKPHAYVDGDAADALSARIVDALARRERDAPWMLGTTTLALARELTIDEPLLLRFLNADVDAGRIGARDGYYFQVGHHPQLSAEQSDFFERAVPLDPAAPLAPQPLAGVVDALRAARIVGLTHAFDTLLATGVLVKVGADVYRGTQIAEIRARLEAAVARDGPITAARFRDAIGTSRKYALPLLEWLDATGVTVRDGDVRRLRDR